MTRPRLVALVLTALALIGCDPGADPRVDPVAGGSPTTEPATAPASTAASATEQRHPDVLDATLARSGDTWEVSATISSPYDTPERYADAFRVLAPGGEVLGVRELLHDHAADQPFTRSLTGLEIPDGVDVVVVEGRDLANGWGGSTVEVAVPR